MIEHCSAQIKGALQHYNTMCTVAGDRAPPSRFLLKKLRISSTPFRSKGYRRNNQQDPLPRNRYNPCRKKHGNEVVVVTLRAVSRSMWYSALLRVWLGATTIESPVCTPRGSKFYTSRAEKIGTTHTRRDKNRRIHGATNEQQAKRTAIKIVTISSVGLARHAQIR